MPVYTTHYLFLTRAARYPFCCHLMLSSPAAMEIDSADQYPDRLPAGSKRKRLHDDHVHSPSPTDSIDLVNSSGIIQDHASAYSQTTKRPRRQETLIASPSASQKSPINVADLPPEILQHIFSFVHPILLGRLLSVCKLFSTLLNPAEALPAPSSGINNTSLRKQNDIWTRSRNIHLQGYPRPMEGMTEIEMWRLLRVRRCQFCLRKARKSPTFLNTSPWNGGPGPDEVRTIWPFRIRSCGSCLGPRLLVVSRKSFRPMPS